MKCLFSPRDDLYREKNHPQVYAGVRAQLTLGREGADALPSFDCQGTADSLGCSVSCMTHIPLAQQISMERVADIPCHPPPPLACKWAVEIS